MNPKALIPLVAGVGIAGLAAKLGFDYLKEARGAPVATVQLWAPVELIPRGTPIGQSLVREIAFPREAVPPGAVTELEQLVGRVPHTGAPAGVPILDSMLLPPGATPGINVPEGLRAVAVKIDESSGVDHHLQPGCRVDVVGYFNMRRAGKSETLAKTILENVEVAAVGERLAPETPDDGEDEGRRGRREKARAVTLLVKPDQVATLHLAEQRGKIKLAMRGFEDAGGPRTSNGHDGGLSEDAMLGLRDPEADAEQAPAEAKPSVFEQLMSRFFAQPENKEDEAPAVAEVPDPVAQEPPPKKEPAWVMNVYQGGDRMVYGWETMTSFQPIEMGIQGPNIFEQGPQGPQRPPWLPPQQPPVTDPVSPPQGPATPPAAPEKPRTPKPGETFREPQTNEEIESLQSEPEELFE